MMNHSKEQEQEQKQENQLTKRFLIFSLLGHMVFALFYLIKLPSKPKEYETMEAEIILSSNLGKDEKEASPEQSVVEKNTLPQLTKNMVIEEESPENGVAIEDLKEKEKEKNRERIKERLQALRLQKIKKEELQKRIMREKARKRKQFARKEKLVLNESLNELKSMSDNLNIMSAGTDSSYRGVAKVWIQRHYEIPDAYEIPKEGIEVQLQVFLGIDGEVTSVKIRKPSSNPMFNRIAVQTVWKSSPLPKPPKEVIGKSIDIIFTPEKL